VEVALVTVRMHTCHCVILTKLVQSDFIHHVVIVNDMTNRLRLCTWNYRYIYINIYIYIYIYIFILVYNQYIIVVCVFTVDFFSIFSLHIKPYYLLHNCLPFPTPNNVHVSKFNCVVLLLFFVLIDLDIYLDWTCISSLDCLSCVKYCFQFVVLHDHTFAVAVKADDG